MSQELSIKARCIAGPKERRLHIKNAIAEARKNGWKELVPSPPHGGEISIVASGPSVKSQIKKIKKDKAKGIPLFAVKGAQQWLLDNGIVPDFAIAVDPQTHIIECFKTVHPDVIYMLGSQVHPWTFQYIHDKGGKIVLWHLYSKTNTDLLANKLQVGGGSTSGLRAITVAYLMGFTDFKLYGFDSCLLNKDSKLRKITGDRYGDKPNERILQLDIAGEKFYADPAFAAQADEFQKIVRTMRDPRRGMAKFRAYGKGLIPAICRDQKKQGNPQFWGVPGESNNDVPVKGNGQVWQYVPANIRRALENPANDVPRGGGPKVQASPHNLQVSYGD